MCGIFGYVGAATNVTPMVANALRTMEYRGYDSWGIGWDDGTALSCLKAPGRVPQALPDVSVSTLAIGHTRWATHGGVTTENAHPHLDCTHQIGVVHNGVVENADVLRRQIDGRHHIASETDSEIVAHLIEDAIASGLPLREGVARVFGRLVGSNAIVACDRRTGEIVAITSRSPLRLGRSAAGWCLASDPIALAAVSAEVVVVPDHAVLSLTVERATMAELGSGAPIALDWSPIPRDMTAELGPFRHFMEKEIDEQPAVVRRLIDRVGDVDDLSTALTRYDHILLTGCGSAYYAASLGAHWLRSHVDAWVEVVPASEVDARMRNRRERTLVIALTQSGETADVVDALHIARSWGAATGAIVNAEASTVARMADYVVPLVAGIERSVLATKSFLAMVVRMLQLSVARDDGARELATSIPVIDAALACDTVGGLASRIAEGDHGITLGKEIGHKVALEAALKIKEGSYVHAEAFLTGELKHGPLALVTGNLPCMLFAMTETEASSARIASREIMSRGGYTVGIGLLDATDCDDIIAIPDCGHATALPAIVLAQRIGYSVAVARGVDPDYPRNLAKSVTVR